MSFLKPQISFSSSFASIFSVIKHNSSVFFSSNIIYFGQKQSIKVKIFEIFECSDQNWSNSSCQFWNDNSISLQFLHHSSLSWHITSLKKLIHFQLWTNKVLIFETFKCSGQNWLNFSCHIWKHKSLFLQVLHQTSVPSNITPLHFFSSNIIYFGQNQSIKVKIFEIFKCSCQNWSNSSCQFWIDKSVPLQFLHRSSLSWHITPL